MAGSNPESNTVLRPPLVAARDAGQLLNEAFFHLRQAVLLPLPMCRQQQRLFEQRLDELALVVRETVEGTVQRDDLRDRIREELSDWRAELASEQFAEAWNDAFHELGATLQGCYQNSLHETRRAACDDLLRPVEASLARVRLGIENSLDESQLQAFRLGEFLDQGLRPADVLKAMYPPAVGELEATPGDNQACEEVDIGDIATTPRRVQAIAPLDYCPTMAVSTTGILPGDEWHAEFRQRWLQLGLSPSEPPAIAVENDLTAFEAFIEAATNAACRIVGQGAQLAASSHMAS
jgi:hypothetical protein